MNRKSSTKASTELNSTRLIGYSASSEEGEHKMGYRYKVVPFLGSSTGSLSATTVANQLQSLITEHASQGWEFYQISDVNIEVQPGCVGSLFGATVQYVRFDQLIFRGDDTVVTENLLDAVSPSRSGAADVGAGKSFYRPEKLASGKIKCWNCGEANHPEQDKCWDCFSNLYEKN